MKYLIIAILLIAACYSFAQIPVRRATTGNVIEDRWIPSPIQQHKHEPCPSTECKGSEGPQGRAYQKQVDTTKFIHLQLFKLQCKKCKLWYFEDRQVGDTIVVQRRRG